VKGLPKGYSWDALLEAAAAFQGLVPDAVLVGGSAAALLAGHRFSRDADHVIADLPQRFDELLAALEGRHEWVTARVRKPVLILGSFRNVETGLRQLRRTTPLETTTVETPHGRIRVPTPEELLRIKAWLALVRNQTRDYLDVLALADRLGPAAAVRALGGLDRHYRDLYRAETGRDVSALLQLARQLADPQPEDQDWMDLHAYKGLGAPWTDWSYVRRRAAELAGALLEAGLDERSDG
jgi:hypothetical protein